MMDFIRGIGGSIERPFILTVVSDGNEKEKLRGPPGDKAGGPLNRC